MCGGRAHGHEAAGQDRRLAVQQNSARTGLYVGFFKRPRWRPYSFGRPSFRSSRQRTCDQPGSGRVTIQEKQGDRLVSENHYEVVILLPNPMRVLLRLHGFMRPVPLDLLPDWVERAVFVFRMRTDGGHQAAIRRAALSQALRSAPYSEIIFSASSTDMRCFLANVLAS